MRPVLFTEQEEEIMEKNVLNNLFAITVLQEIKDVGLKTTTNTTILTHMVM
jgi:hypothetical protein